MAFTVCIVTPSVSSGVSGLDVVYPGAWHGNMHMKYCRIFVSLERTYDDAC